MKKTPLPTEHYNLSDSLADHPLIQWITNNGTLLLGLLFALVAIGLGYARWDQSSGSGTDSVAAETAYREFAQTTDEKKQTEAYAQLLAILKKQPELHAKYDGLIGQILLNRGQPAEAKEYVTATLKRTKADGLDTYADYSTTTLLLSNGIKSTQQDFTKALDKALELNQKLVASQRTNVSEEGQMLYLFNLIRIAFIYQELGQKADELKTWRVFKASPVKAAHNPLVVDSWVYEQVIDQLGSGSETLVNYIDSREKLLDK